MAVVRAQCTMCSIGWQKRRFYDFYDYDFLPLLLLLLCSHSSAVAVVCLFLFFVCATLSDKNVHRNPVYTNRTCVCFCLFRGTERSNRRLCVCGNCEWIEPEHKCYSWHGMNRGKVEPHKKMMHAQLLIFNVWRTIFFLPFRAVLFTMFG